MKGFLLHRWVKKAQIEGRSFDREADFRLTVRGAKGGKGLEVGDEAEEKGRRYGPGIAQSDRISTPTALIADRMQPRLHPFGNQLKSGHKLQSPQMIIEPGQNMGEWDRRDPKYAAMVQQVVGKISTRPGDKTEMGDVHVSAELSRPKPMNRHTSAATGPDEETVVAPGTLNVAGVRQLFLEYQSEREGHDKPVDTKSLAERYDVDAVLLERIFHYTSLPDALRRDSRDQIPDQKLKMSPVSY